MNLSTYQPLLYVLINKLLQIDPVWLNKEICLHRIGTQYINISKIKKYSMK